MTILYEGEPQLTGHIVNKSGIRLDRRSLEGPPDEVPVRVTLDMRPDPTGNSSADIVVFKAVSTEDSPPTPWIDKTLKGKEIAQDSFIHDYGVDWRP